MNTQLQFSRAFYQYTIAALLVACGLLATRVSADEQASQQRDLFEIQVRPTLVTHCIKCHGDAKQEGGLRLTSLEGLLKGGESGPAIVPEKSDECLLLEVLRYESFEMAPSGQLEGKVVDGILHLMGLDHKKLIYVHKGRPERIDQNEGRAFKEIAAS